MADNKERTVEELTTLEFNYYWFYKIKPRCKDEIEIRRTIVSKLNNSIDIPFRYLELRQDALDTMLDVSKRAKEKAALKKLVLNKAVDDLRKSYESIKIINISDIKRSAASQIYKIKGETIFSETNLINACIKTLTNEGFYIKNESKEEIIEDTIDDKEDFFRIIDSKGLSFF